MIEKQDIVLISNNMFFSKMIKEVTDGKWSHVAGYIGDGKVIESLVSTNGVTENYLRHYFTNDYKMKLRRCVLEYDKKKFIKILKKQVGKKYGWLQLIVYLLRFVAKIRINFNFGGLTCSGLYAYVFKRCGIPIKKDLKWYHVVPEDFDKSFNFKDVKI